MYVFFKKAENNQIKNRAIRKALLARLLKQIHDKEFSNLQQPGRATRPFISPVDRSSNNYSYMTMDEMGAGSPNIP